MFLDLLCKLLSKLCVSLCFLGHVYISSSLKDNSLSNFKPTGIRCATGSKTLLSPTILTHKCFLAQRGKDTWRVWKSACQSCSCFMDRFIEASDIFTQLMQITQFVCASLLEKGTTLKLFIRHLQGFGHWPWSGCNLCQKSFLISFCQCLGRVR